MLKGKKTVATIVAAKKAAKPAGNAGKGAKEGGGEDEFMDEPQFPSEEISIAVKTVLDQVIGSEMYTDERMAIWNGIIIDGVLAAISQLQKPFKYAVLSTITQKSGTGLHSGSSCFWDPQTDGCCSVRWENSYCYVIVTIFGLTFGQPIRS